MAYGHGDAASDVPYRRACAAAIQRALSGACRGSVFHRGEATMTAKKKSAAKKAKKKKAAKKTAAKKKVEKKPAAKKKAAKKSGAKKATNKAAKKAPKKAAKKPSKKGAAKKATPPGSDAKKPAPKKAASAKGGIASGEVHMGHLFSLRPRVNMSFKPDDLRAAKQRLVDESYATIGEAARAVADLALELSHSGGKLKPHGRANRRL